MTGTENVFDGFALLGDDEEFDVDKIFGSGSDEPAPPPPAPTLAEEAKPQFDPEQVQTETAESQPEPEQTLPAKTQEVPAEEANQPLELFSAFTGAESDPHPRGRTGQKHKAETQNTTVALRQASRFSVRRRQRADHGCRYDL